ncbi:SGNH/GDSL hydrolase family protein [Pseudomonas psychrophila]|uniref:SGNH/GDSL hydrolase family protein n=1 Tax=Pseudomonas psychrophila TaxID=122355 RepID=UPI0002D8542E|nr:SGNH/GDSL hydrolase family protein [Pseudomonas psychrophila]
MSDIESLQAYAGQLAEAAAQAKDSAGKQHEYINGDASKDVLTESGLVPTIAKQALLGQAKVTASLAEVASQTAGAMTYASTALGLLGTNNDGYFSVPSPESREYLILYKNSAGVAIEVDRYPNAEAVNKKVNGIKGKNLLNPAAPDVALGFFPNSIAGDLQANVAYNCSGFIPVVAGQVYTASQKHYWTWYNARKVFISGTSDANQNKTQTAPSGAAFMRCSFSAGSKWAFAQVESGSVQSAFEPFIAGAFLDPLAVKDNSLGGRTMADASITREKTNFLKAGKNLFNKAAATIGQFINPISGSLTSSATYDTTEKIAVTAGQQYVSNRRMRFSCYFAADGGVVSGGASEYISSFTTPAGAAYVRITLEHNNLDLFQLEHGSAPTSFEVYGWKVEGPNGEKLIQEPVGTASLQDASVTREKTNFLKAGKNLFNKAAATIGQLVDPISGSLTSSATYDTTEKIAVTAGQQYVSNRRMRFSCYFAADGSTVIAGGINDGGGVFTFAVPAGAAYARVTLWHTDLDMFQLEKGAVSTSFESYGWKVEGPNGETLVNSESGAASSSKWSGKTWAALGDSISAQGTWQPDVVTSLGLKWSNFGIGGTKLSGPVGDTTAMCQDTRINAIPVTQDLVTVMAGTNDWAQNVPLGAQDSTDPLTFYGALNTLIGKLMARFPAKRVALFTLPYGEIYDFAKRGWPNAYTNTQGLTTLDYAEAIRVACKRWGLPCVDVQGNAGWNALNIRTYINDDGALLHPNKMGAARVAEVAIGILRGLEAFR